MADDAPNPRVFLGANNPPDEPTPFDAIRVHIEDLLTEAHAWADGNTVETQAQADEASRLIDELRKAAKAAEDVKAAEQKVHDDAIAEIRGRYNPLIQDPKTKTPGKVWKAIDALKATVKPFLDKQEAERREAAERARREAAEAARIAAEAARAASASDLAGQEAAEELVAAARRAEADAKQIENSRTQARGGDRAMGLRKTYTPELTDRKAALLHYLAQQPSEFEALLMQLAQRDVRAGKRQIPGFQIIEGTTL